MDKILLGLKDFVSYHTNDKSKLKLSASSDEFLESLTLECEDIKTKTRHKFLLLQGDRINAPDLITFLQRDLCSFRNGLADDSPEYSSLSAATDNLIDFLRDEFSGYFNHELPVSSDYVRAKISEQLPLGEWFREAMDHAHADPMLTELIDDYLQQNGYVIRKFSQMKYYLEFAEKLEVVLAKISALPIQIRVWPRQVERWISHCRVVALAHFAAATYFAIACSGEVMNSEKLCSRKW